MKNNTQIQQRKVRGWTFSTVRKHIKGKPHYTKIESCVNGSHALVSDRGKDKKIMPVYFLRDLIEKKPDWVIDREGLENCIQEFDESDLVSTARKLNESEQKVIELEQALIKQEQSNNRLLELNKIHKDESSNLEQKLNKANSNTKNLEQQIIKLEQQRKSAIELANKNKDGKFDKWAFDGINIVLALLAVMSCLTIFTFGEGNKNLYSLAFGLVIASLFILVSFGMNAVMRRGKEEQKKVALGVLIVFSLSELAIHFITAKTLLSDVVGNVGLFAACTAIVLAFMNFMSFWFKK